MVTSMLAGLQEGTADVVVGGETGGLVVVTRGTVVVTRPRRAVVGGGVTLLEGGVDVPMTGTVVVSGTVDVVVSGSCSVVVGGAWAAVSSESSRVAATAMPAPARSNAARPSAPSRRGITRRNPTTSQCGCHEVIWKEPRPLYGPLSFQSATAT